MAKPKQNLYGQEMKSKGTQTRTRILEATAILMEKRPIRELKVAEISALAAVSTSTFYLYFESVPEAALAVVEGLHQGTPEIMAILKCEWTSENVMHNCKAFVQAYFQYWDRHHALLRVRNFAADEGDLRFHEARRRSVDEIHLSLQAQIRSFQEKFSSQIRLDPPSTVSVLMAMLERTAAIVRLRSAHKATRGRQIESAAFLIASTMICVGHHDSNQQTGRKTGESPLNHGHQAIKPN
jgi:AcrR family transcriptional regulator